MQAFPVEHAGAVGMGEHGQKDCSTISHTEFSNWLDGDRWVRSVCTLEKLWENAPILERVGNIYTREP